MTGKTHDEKEMQIVMMMEGLSGEDDYEFFGG